MWVVMTNGSLIWGTISNLLNGASVLLVGVVLLTSALPGLMRGPVDPPTDANPTK